MMRVLNNFDAKSSSGENQNLWRFQMTNVISWKIKITMCHFISRRNVFSPIRSQKISFSSKKINFFQLSNDKILPN